MNHPLQPSFDDYLNMDIEAVRETVPQTFIYAASGTRRAAVLAGMPSSGDEYAWWSKAKLFRCVELIFQHGIKHLCVPLLEPGQFRETTTDYQEHIWRWYVDGLTGPEALDLFQRKGWRVRLAFGEFIPQLQAGSQILKSNTPPDAECTLWCFAIPDFEKVWEWVFEAAQASSSYSYPAVVKAVYGEKIPSASIYLGTVKPLLSILQLPPLLLSSEVQCYWSLRPGYSLDQTQLRSILYDYTYLRQTWQEDKSGRAEQALTQRQIWERGDVLGLGKHLGPFWYPDLPQGS